MLATQASLSDRSVNTRFSRDRASLSVVLLSMGSRNDLERAVTVLTPSLRRFGAQLVVARAEDDVTAPSMNQDLSVSFIRAPKGANRAELCDLGMAAATGDIVALREDTSVRDSEWMESFSGTVRISGPMDAVVVDHNVVSSSRTSDVQGPPSDQVLPEVAVASEQIPASKGRISIPLSDRRSESRRVVARDA